MAPEKMKKIMVVDDDKEFLNEVSEILRLSDYQVVAVYDETKVLKIAEKEKPDLVLLDLKLGRESGFNLARELRGLQVMAYVPIVAVTGYYTDAEYSELMRVCGISRHLTKPISPQEMIILIEDMLGE